jgi:hypothetical protein
MNNDKLATPLFLTAVVTKITILWDIIIVR